MMNSYIGGYNQMGYGGFNQMGQMGNPSQNNPMEAGAFRNVYGIIGKKNLILYIISKKKFIFNFHFMTLVEKILV